MTDTTLRLGLNLDNVAARATEWLVPNVLAKGMPTMLVGDGGVGKTTLTGRWAADIACGRPLVPGGKVVPAGHVIFVSVEDDPERVLKPRFMAAGADHRNITLLRDVPLPSGGRRRIQLPGDTQVVLDAIRDSGAVLLVLDPIFSVLDDKHDAYKSPHVYRAMGTLFDGCQEAGCASLYNLHVNKNRANGATMRHEGAMAWKNMSRVSMFVAPDPEDEGFSVLAQSKSNMGRAQSWRFHVESVPFRDLGIDDPDGDNTAGKLVWDGPSSLTAEDLNAGGGSREERSERRDAATLWHHLVGDEVDAHGRVLRHGGVRVRMEDATREARAWGIGQRELVRARGALGIVRHQDGFQAPVFWGNPEAALRPAPLAVTPFAPNGANGHHPGEAVPPRDALPVCSTCGRDVNPDLGCRICAGSFTVWKSKEEMGT